MRSERDASRIGGLEKGEKAQRWRSCWTNPYKKDLADAEKQLRQQQRRGAEVSNIINAQLKVENMFELQKMR